MGEALRRGSARPAAARASGLALAAAALVAAAAFAGFQLVWPLAFPPVWSDETYFLVPALNVAAGGLPRAPELFSPDGVFWMPSGMYFLNGAVFAALGEGGLRLARGVAFAETLVAALLLREIARDRLRGLPGAEVKATLAALAWLLCLPVMLSANVARPEALVLALSLGALLALGRGAPLGAAAIALLAGLTHPLLAGPAVAAVGAGVLLGPLPRRPRAWEWAAAATAAALLAFEAGLLARHYDEYLAHWRMQLARKADRPLRPEAVAAAAAGAAALAWGAFGRRRRGAAAAAEGGAGEGGARAWTAALAVYGWLCLAVQFYGQEMWYWPVAATGAAALGLAVAPALADAPLARRVVGATPAFLLVLALSAGTWALALRDRGYMHFTARPARLAALAEARTTAAEAAHLRLRQDRAGLVLVSPFWWDDFRALAARDGGPDYRSWTPFAAFDAAAIDHAALIGGAYPPGAPGEGEALPEGAPAPCGPAASFAASPLSLRVIPLGSACD